MDRILKLYVAATLSVSVIGASHIAGAALVREVLHTLSSLP
jgi:hypothetical protein